VTIAAIKESIPLSGDLTMPEYKELIKEKFLRELICLSRLYYNKRIENNPTILNSWKWHQKTLSKKIFYGTIEKVATIFKKYDAILKLEQKYQIAIRKNPFYFEVKTILKKEQPKIIFCCHQRGIKAAAVFAAAKDLGIATTTVIYSWDNLPKARMALRADQYLVWSDHMKKEMAAFYPEISQEKVLITGTPQFECYNNLSNIISKVQFYENYDLDVNKKTICFSGDDVLTSPDDPKYLNDLAEELVLKGMDKDYQILLRRCPVDISGRYDAVVEKYAALIRQAPPLWRFNKIDSWTSIYPLPEDIQLLVSTAYYCDIVINVGSTMALDFAMFKKPCVFINYDQERKQNLDWSVKTIYQYQHFRSMPSAEAVSWWSKKEEITAILRDSQFNDKMLDWNNIVIGDYKNAGLKIHNLLKNL
jgi:CDP-glycerol glycerophosphotransferase (TagB/SpsB family)